MAEHHRPAERVQLFRKGWQRGAGARAIPDDLKDDPDFQEGYKLGYNLLGSVMEYARMRYGAPPASILRTQEVARACSNRYPQTNETLSWLDSDELGMLVVVLLGEVLLEHGDEITDEGLLQVLQSRLAGTKHAVSAEESAALKQEHIDTGPHEGCTCDHCTCVPVKED